MPVARIARFLLTAVLLSVAGAVQALPAVAASGPTAAPSGLPSGVPPAALRPEPRLPRPTGWPFPEAFPRTSGTGRMHAGATYWTDFVYDDHGALGVFVDSPISSLAPTLGTYTYPEGPASNNGADIFRAAVGLDAGSSYWRVDWNTLVETRVPVAMWAFDTDRSTRTGINTWPAGARVDSPGVDRALIVSAGGAWLLGPDGRRMDVRESGGSLHIDSKARSFVVAVPRRALPVSGTWRVRLAAGLANPAGTGFAPVPVSRGARPNGPAVYNVAFRTKDQEPALSGNGPAPDLRGIPIAQVVDGNMWNESGQAAALMRGDVSPFFRDVRWSDLASGRREPEPLPTGYSVRWYVTSLDLGQGVVADDSGSAQGDAGPNYLSRIQPYAVYVPTGYRSDRPAPLTWVLHSLGVNHNQYGAVAPGLLDQACERRGSICASILGFGPDGWYRGEAEVSFWEVWRQLATHYRLDPDRTVISGYSMGGYGTYRLGLTYPHLFAKAMPLAGPPTCGVRVVGPLAGPAADDALCAADGDTKPLVPNARWLPFVIGHGAVDELVPVTGVIEQVRAFDTAGYRYQFLLHPTGDHMVWATQDAFGGEIERLGRPKRVRNPGRITFVWYPDHTDTDLGVGPTGAYWISGVQARDSRPGVLASIEATSHARPDPRVTIERDVSVSTPGGLSPAVVRSLSWRLGPRPEPESRIDLSLVNVSFAGIDMGRAGLSAGSVAVTTDGSTMLWLAGLSRGTEVTAGDQHVVVDGTGVAAVTVSEGRTTLLVG